MLRNKRHNFRIKKVVGDFGKRLELNRKAFYGNAKPKKFSKAPILDRFIKEGSAIRKIRK